MVVYVYVYDEIFDTQMTLIQIQYTMYIYLFANFGF